ncbi:MAG: MBOAT family O-acyltransferase [Planctomycetota bacterium]
MLFTELRFFAFFLVALAVYWGMRRDGWRKTWLLACSYVFYGAWDPRFLALIVASTVIDFFAGAWVARAATPGRRRLGVAVSLVANLGLLGFFKYYNFFVESAAGLLEAFGFEPSLSTLRIILPVGISFYTFQTLSYTLDIYFGSLKPTRSLRDFALFVAFFPQLVAGPIVRARDFLPQLDSARRWADVAVRSHLALFVFGFVKKACVSDNVAILTDQVFAYPEAYGVLDKWMAVGLYAVQIYCDFSGYTDMAIASAGLLGYSLTLNFNFPFFSVSITDFWRRWHISMMSWFRDYVYIAFGGNRAGTVRTYSNLLLTFFLAGLWHGANWNFVLFGLFNGVFLMVERWGIRNRGFDPFRPRLWGRVYMLWVIAMSYVLFRNPDFPAAWTYFKGLYWSQPLVAAEGAAPVDPRWWLVVFGFGFVHWLMWRRFLHRFFAGLPDWVVAVVLGVLTALLLPLLPTEYQPFIYFQF